MPQVCRNSNAHWKLSSAVDAKSSSNLLLHAKSHQRSEPHAPKITVRKALLQTSAEKVKSAVQAAQNALETSREKAKVLLNSFTAAGSFLTDTIIHNYNDYFHNQLTQEDWRTAWEQDGPKIGMVEFSLSVFGKKRRERLEKRLRTPIEKLIGGSVECLERPTTKCAQ